MFQFRLKLRLTFKLNSKFNFKLRFKFKLKFKLNFKFSFTLILILKVVISSETNVPPYTSQLSQLSHSFDTLKFFDIQGREVS